MSKRFAEPFLCEMEEWTIILLSGKIVIMLAESTRMREGSHGGRSYEE
jgi:hypothetical protein